jgi:hypothetical protein
LTASGAAFTAVVQGQFANAFACRSEHRSPWALGWASNPLLIGAVAVELVALLAFVGLPFLAELLGHQPPNTAGFAVALLAGPAVLAADAVDKMYRGGRAEGWADGSWPSPTTARSWPMSATQCFRTVTLSWPSP